MKKITFNPSNITLEVEKGATILEAARKAGLVIESPCNGAGVCGKCRLYTKQIAPIGALLVKKSEFTSSEEDQCYVLACNACIEENVIVSLIEKKQEKSLKILSNGISFQVEIPIC